ncbi:titin [Astyanax mexicanus]|uniref:Titin n=1 Tax=Astyanax mexicanus TaxID=7994 RepID=A0A8T2LJX8_ASTMX|nr:titin [Astyanax mexicanus]
MTLTWKPPESDGGSSVAGYIIERKEAGSDRWLRINKNPVTMTRYRSTGLIEGLEYEYRNLLYLHESFDSLEEYVLIYEFISGMDIFERLGTNFDSSTIKIIEMGQARLLTPGENLRIQFTAPEYCAPEVHNSDFVTTATDMWSVGVLAYVLLSGLNPFAAESTQKMIEHISNAEYVFDSEAFREISIEGMDFVDRLLIKERKHRMTASEALEHPWLRTKIENISSKVIKTLRHRRYYQSLAKKEWSASISAARVAYGGGYRNQKNVSFGRVKVATPEEGLRAGPVMHGSAEEGGHVRFVCSLQHYDKNTEVTWYFGSRKLTASHKYEINYANGVASIYVKDIEECDDGLYRCKVVTEEREDNAYAELFVETVRSHREYYLGRTLKKPKRRIDKTKILQRPPEFTLPLYNRTAYIGEDVRFGVTITVHPEPQVTWLKAGHRIKPDPAKYTFTSDKGLYQLMIHNVELVDDGEYTVVANNKFGEDSCKARLTVTPHPVVEDTMRPMFKRLLANIECVEGQSVQFDLRVSGTPPPTLKWEKDGKPLECRPQVEVVQQAVDHHILYIRETLIEDSGTYRVTATNSAGSASCQATLKVERITYTRREFKSVEDKQKYVQNQIEKTLKMAQQFSKAEVMALNPVAQEALKEAAELYKPAVSTKNVQGEFDISDKEDKEIKKIKEEGRKIRMPYEIPEARVHDPTVLEEDMGIKHFVPLSDMKWYKKLRDQYEIPERMERIVQKRQKRIRLSRWEQFYVMPLPRITDQYRPRWHIPKLTLDDLETVRPARRSPSPTSEVSFRMRRRSLGDLSDEEEYLAKRRTDEEREEFEEELELGFSASPPSGSPVCFELSALRRPSPRVVHKAEVKPKEEARRAPVTEKPRGSPPPISHFMRRRRSLSPTYIELMRPVSELVRPSRPYKEVEAEAVEIVERRSPTPERTRPRSPSPVSPERRSSRSSSRFERSARFDIMSRYEARKAAIKSERTYQVVTQQPFSLDHAPRITVRMRSHRVPSGQDTKFTLNVQSKPEAEIQWFHNGQSIQESSKYRFTNMSGVLTLHITDCQADDTGTYRVVCTNSKGETSDYGTLDVSGGAFTTYSSRRKDDEVTAAFVPDITKTDYYHTTTVRASSASRTHLEIAETKTKITEKREVSAFERYESERIASSPIRHASTEYLSSASYSSSERYASETKTKTKTVEATATAEVATKKTKATLAAKILTKPQSQTVSLGESVRFTCDIDGEPAPTVSWMFAGRTIVTSQRVRVTTTQYKSTLEISSVEYSDEGNYSVVVENSEGRQEAKFTLTISKPAPKAEVVKSPEPAVKSPEPSVKSPEPSVKSPEPSVKSPEPSVTSPVPSVKSPEPAVTSPVPSVKSPEPSVKSPEPAGVKSPEPRIKSPEGIKSPIRVKSPEPGVKSPTPLKSPEPPTSPFRVKSPTGLKSPEPIASPPRVKSPPPLKSPEPLTSPQRIKSPTGMKSPEPAASPLRVKSPTGLKSPEPRIKSPTAAKSPEPITSPKRVKSPLTVKAPPKILQQLKAEASEDKVKLICVAESSVKEVVWYKESRKLSQSSRYQIQTAADGTCSLFISDVSESDQGEYFCEMIAESGAASRTSFSLVGQVFQSIYAKVNAFVSTHMAIRGTFNSFFILID